MTRPRPHRQLCGRRGPPAMASGSACSGLTRGAGSARCSWRSTTSCTARWRSSRSSRTTPTTRSAASGSSLEAEITGGLEHPGIVPVYGLGTYAGGRPYYAMRFIKGDSLKEAIEQFHDDDALKNDPGRRSLGAAQAPAPLHRRLQRHRLRPLPRRDAPRHQAGQHHRGQARRDAGGRLGAGQAAGRADPARIGERTLMPSSCERIMPRRCPAVPWARRPT